MKGFSSATAQTRSRLRSRDSRLRKAVFIATREDAYKSDYQSNSMTGVSPFRFRFGRRFESRRRLSRKWRANENYRASRYQRAGNERNVCGVSELQTPERWSSRFNGIADAWCWWGKRLE